MEKDFKTVPHQGNNYPFIYSPLTAVRVETFGRKFRWDFEPAYRFETGAACKKFEDMYDNTKCKEQRDFVPMPNAVPTYRMLIENLVKNIEKHAPERILAEDGKTDSSAFTLNGVRMKDFMIQGIKEMNRVGPLPQTELWRRIMQDRCAADLRDYLDFTYGERKGEVDDKESTGLLLTISEGLEVMRSGRIDWDDLAPKWLELEKTWKDADLSQTTLDDWFTGKVLMKAVQPSCNKTGVMHMNFLLEVFGRLETEWTVIQERIALHKAQQKIDALNRELDDLKNKGWFEENAVC